MQGNFLTPEVIGERLAGARVAERLGHWLAQPANAERAGEAAADALGGVVEVLDDRDVQEALGTAVEKRLKSTEVAPVLGKAIDVAIEGGHHHRMLDGVMRGLVTFLDDNRSMLRDRLDQESPWWVPEAIDDRVFKKIFTGVERFLADVSATPDHEVRRSIDARIRALAVKLRDDPVLIAKCETMKLGAARAPRRAGLAAVVVGRGQVVTAAMPPSDPNSDLRRRLVHGFATAGRRLEVDHELQAKVDGWIEQRRPAHRRALPRRGRRADLLDRRAVGLRRNGRGASSYRSAATSSSSASTAPWSAASPASPSTPFSELVL